MVGLESSMDNAESAQKYKKPKQTDKDRDMSFLKQLRARKAEQPKGAKY